MKEHTTFTLISKTKEDLVRYIEDLEKRINRSIKKLDKIEEKEAWRIMQILKGEK